MRPAPRCDSSEWRSSACSASCSLNDGCVPRCGRPRGVAPPSGLLTRLVNHRTANHRQRRFITAASSRRWLVRCRGRPPCLPGVTQDFRSACAVHDACGRPRGVAPTSRFQAIPVIHYPADHCQRRFITAASSRTWLVRCRGRPPCLPGVPRRFDHRDCALVGGMPSVADRGRKLFLGGGEAEGF